MEVSRRRLHAFEEFIMHDAQEFLLAILNNVSSEIKEHVHEIIKNNITSTSENMATYKRTIPEFFIETLFQGKLLSEVVCNECQNKTCTVDTFVDLSLPIKLTKKKKTSKFLGLIHIKKNKSPQKTSKVVIQLNGVQIYSQSLAKKPLFSSNFFKIKNQKNERSRSRSISYIPLIKTNSHEQIQCMSENIDIFQFYQQQNGKCISESKSMNADSSRCVIQIGQFYNIYYTATKTPQVEIIEAVPKIEVPATKEQLRNIQNLYKMKERRKSRCSSWPKVVNTMLNFDTSHLRRAISLNLHQNINQTRNIDLSSSNIGDSAYMFFSQPQNPEFDSQAEPDSHSNTFHDVPENSLYSCLNNFFATETFENSNEIYCQNCTEKFKTKIYSKASKKFRILKLPRHLIIHLKRFKQIDDNIIKVHDHIKFPETLNLKQYCRLRGTSSVYSLFAVIEHIGGLQIGHYIAYVRFSTAGKRWYIVNDGCVKEVPIDDVLKANAYILFYDAKI
ncbi:hypothetical protein HZS_1291 [Henneguya salminicola]|nr:hypothetical protein HZS_1291 [Henneguya salminicola]